MKNWRRAAAAAAVAGTFGISLASAAPVAAATSVTPGPVSPNPGTAGAASSYTIALTVATALPAGGTITLVAPSGTDFSPCASDCAGAYSVGVNNGDSATVASAAATTSGGSPTRNQIVLTLGSSTVGSGDQVTITTAGTTNPQTASTTYTLQESTSTDTTPADSPDYSITASSPSTITPTQGSVQSAQEGHAFPTDLAVQVEDAFGNPVGGATVTFQAPISGASGTFDTTSPSCPGNAGAGAPDADCIVTANSSGVATASTFTANNTSGSYDVTATVSTGTGAGTASAPLQLENQGAAPATVTAGAVSANPATEAHGAVTYTIGFTTNAAVPDGDTITILAPNGTAYPANNCVPSCADYTVTYGSGTSVTVSAVAVSDVDGPGSTTQSTGSNKAVITVGSALPPGTAIPADEPVTVTISEATNPKLASRDYYVEESDQVDATPVGSGNYAITPSAATNLVIDSGSGQAAMVGTAFAQPLTVTAEDKDGNPVLAGTPVTFVLPDGSAHPSGAFPDGSTQQTDETNASGQVSSSVITANDDAGLWDATAALAGGASPRSFALQNDSSTAPHPVTNTGGTKTEGYWLAGSDGSVQIFGDAPFYGSMAGHPLTKPVVGMASVPGRNGYWLVASDGGIFSFGAAQFHGSTGAMHLNQPIVGMAATPSGNGYWLVASDGGIFTFGDAKFYGSTGAMHLNRPIVGMAAAPSGKGYWLVASDGGIFTFGDAKFYGSTGAMHLNQPVVGLAAVPGGLGYWLVAADGGIFSFGPGAAFFGSTGNIRLNQPIVAMTAAPSGRGYWFVAHDGGVFTFGPGAQFKGSGAAAGEAVVDMVEG